MRELGRKLKKAFNTLIYLGICYGLGMFVAWLLQPPIMPHVQMNNIACVYSQDSTTVQLMEEIETCLNRYDKQLAKYVN